MAIIDNLEKYKKVYLFGHCDATIRLAESLIDMGIIPVAILDNNSQKYEILYKGIPVVNPSNILSNNQENTAVLIVHRAYETMKKQLRELGFIGEICKIADYNSFSEYSLSETTIKSKVQRLRRGREIIEELRNKYKGSFFVLCPFRALGDVYLCMSYLPEYLSKRDILHCVICVTGKSTADVVTLFGKYDVEIYSQEELDCAIQACIYENTTDTFIAHQDRPYVVNLDKALHLKKIPLEMMYRCGVFGLSPDSKPDRPKNWEECTAPINIGKSVILSPYAKSVPDICESVWSEIIRVYNAAGYNVYTNICGDERPIEGTIGIRPRLCEMKSLVEKAGVFIGIRSGLCDIIREANCRKIALYPDYYYCDTRWKAIDIYELEGFENIVVKDNCIPPIKVSDL